MEKSRRPDPTRGNTSIVKKKALVEAPAVAQANPKYNLRPSLVHKYSRIKQDKENLQDFDEEMAEMLADLL